MCPRLEAQYSRDRCCRCRTWWNWGHRITLKYLKIRWARITETLISSRQKLSLCHHLFICHRKNIWSHSIPTWLIGNIPSLCSASLSAHSNSCVRQKISWKLFPSFASLMQRTGPPSISLPGEYCTSYPDSWETDLYIKLIKYESCYGRKLGRALTGVYWKCKNIVSLLGLYVRDLMWMMGILSFWFLFLQWDFLICPNGGRWKQAIWIL